MRHHRRVHAGEGATLEEQDLAAAALLGRGADDAHGQADVVGDPGRRQAGSHGERRDHVVAAGVPDVGQGVVLGADRDVQRARAGAGDEGGRDVADAALHPEPGRVEGVGQPARGVLLLEGELRSGVDAAAEREQVALARGQALAGAVLGVHGALASRSPSPASRPAATVAGMHDGLLVIDADAHKMENPLVFFDYLDAPYRGRLASRTDRHGEPRLVIRDLDPRTGRPELERVFPQPEGPGKGAFAAIHPETAIGRVFNRIRLEHMDREGIDAQVLYGSMTLSFEAILDPELAVACMRAYNRYIADDCRAWSGRLFPVGFISLADVGEAMREVRRCVEVLGMIGVHLPPSVPVPHPDARDAFPRIRLPKHLCHPDFHPVLAAAAELDVAVGVHGSPGVYLPSGIAEQVDTFILSHIFGHRNQMQMALATCVFDGLFDRFPTLRLGFLEAGCGWLPDLVHAFHEHWEKRIRDFDPDVRLSTAQFTKELLRKRGGTDGKLHLLGKANGIYDLLVHVEREPRAASHDAFTFEHRTLDHDPVDFFRRGQVYVSFESDDPAPAYLREALGDVGEDVACFSADYGHWDGVLTDCVRNVTRARPYAREHLQKLLAGNCLRFYGRLLEAAVERLAA